MEKRNIGRFTCEKCGRDYKRKQALRNHLKYECSIAPQFHCPMCSYCSKWSSNLKQHIIGVHNSASSSEESDPGVDDEMKDASASEDDSDSNCSEDTNSNNHN